MLSASFDLLAVLINKLVPHTVGALDSIRVRRKSFISLNIQ